jgi:hypothetical protein
MTAFMIPGAWPIEGPMTPSKRVFPALLAVLLPVTLASTAGPVGACSLFLDRVDLDESAHDLDAALEKSGRLVRVEVVATSPPFATSCSAASSSAPTNGGSTAIHNR